VSGRVLAATKAAGTAHLDDTQVSTSPNPDLRGSSAGTGAVDFATGSFQITDVDHEMEWSSDSGGPIHPHAETTSEGEIAIGPTLYPAFGPGSIPSGWSKTPGRRNESDPGLASAHGF
jgi:hypothetical protein